ncbi:MAG: S41 family peptidase [Acidimicrobiia bacterium]
MLTLEQFLAEAGKLTVQQRAKLIEQAQVLIGQLYVHLPLKRAMHACDPEQRLRLLAKRQEALSERAFHDEMIDIFTELRDLHTNYILPMPYQGRTAFLPFLVEEFFEAGRRRYLVSKTLAGLNHPTFRAGVELTSWSGVPIERAVELNAERQAGSNADARLARGLEALTIRTMAMSAPPDEHWVIVGYKDAAGDHELRLPWQVFQPDPAPSGLAALGAQGSAARTLGLDLRTELARRAKKSLFNPTAMRVEQAVGSRSRRRPSRETIVVADDGTATTLSADETSSMPDVFAFRTVVTPSGTFGYVRIWTFMVQDANAFVDEFVRITRLLPQNGIIIDVRGNGGGNILCAEQLLQVLTPNHIEPSALSFINTPLTEELCRRNSFIGQWERSIRQAFETGETYSQALALLPDDAYNERGQQYPGPVALIVDPLCYSATDIFSAGFQDNAVGKILSAGGRTGAGGANVWDYTLLRKLWTGKGSPFVALPNEATFRVSIRRVTRAGANRGIPLEDLGVTPDATHNMTRNDIMNGNTDLINAAGALLI